MPPAAFCCQRTGRNLKGTTSSHHAEVTRDRGLWGTDYFRAVARSVLTSATATAAPARTRSLTQGKG
jgi:hypothetical protein